MVKAAVTDPTAGTSAGRVTLRPELSQPILDPTDPRYGANRTRVGLESPQQPLPTADRRQTEEI